jgi:hypothetical protein
MESELEDISRIFEPKFTTKTADGIRFRYYQKHH